MKLALNEIAGIIGAAQTGSPLPISGYSIDSRTVQPGELFFAVRGERLDGHDYVPAALDAGAAAAVVGADRMAGFPSGVQPRLLSVPSPLSALQGLAAAVRQRWGGPVVAITGSAGKTTTKQMIAALLRTRYRVLENQGNLNNHFGLPLSLLRLEPEHEIGVFELGMSASGEIRLLAGFSQPDVGVVTKVSEAHLEFFRTWTQLQKRNLNWSNHWALTIGQCSTPTTGGWPPSVPAAVAAWFTLGYPRQRSSVLSHCSRTAPAVGSLTCLPHRTARSRAAPHGRKGPPGKLKTHNRMRSAFISRCSEGTMC
jgi:hypothetical protein